VWEEKFPLSTVQALIREVLDHTPLLLNSGEPSHIVTSPMFKYELGWLLRDGFMDMVQDIWMNTTVGCTPMEQWQGKIRRLRQHLRGWTKNISGQYKKGKKEILNTLTFLIKRRKYTTTTRGIKS
jgi:hypothetical protein